MSAILLDSQIFHYEVLGRGRPVIFIHGWIGSWRYWIPTMQIVSTSYRAYAVDLWGFGDTAKYKACYSLDQQVDLIYRFIEQMGIMRLALVGHGLGAVAAMLFAHRHVDIVDRVIAIGYPLRQDLINPKLRNTSPGDLAEWVLGKGVQAEPVLSDAPRTDVEAIRTSLTGINHLDLLDLWKNLPIASLLVYGEKDPIVAEPRPEDLDELPDLGHSVTFEQSGHFPMLDESSKFGRLLIDFLTLKSGESVRQLQLKEEWKRRIR